MLLFSNVVSCTGTSDIYSKLIYFSGDTSSNRSVDYVCYFFDDEMSWSWYQTIEQMGWRINRNLLKSKAQIKQIILKLIIELNLGEYSKTLKNAPFSFLADFIVVFTNLCFRELLNTTFLQICEYWLRVINVYSLHSDLKVTCFECLSWTSGLFCPSLMFLLDFLFDWSSCPVNDLGLQLQFRARFKLYKIARPHTTKKEELSSLCIHGHSVWFESTEKNWVMLPGAYFFIFALHRNIENASNSVEIWNEVVYNFVIFDNYIIKF